MSHRRSIGADTCPDCLHGWDDHERDAGGIGWRCGALVQGHRCTCDAKPPHAGGDSWESNNGD